MDQIKKTKPVSHTVLRNSPTTQNEYKLISTGKANI